MRHAHHSKTQTQRDLRSREVDTGLDWRCYVLKFSSFRTPTVRHPGNRSSNSVSERCRRKGRERDEVKVEIVGEKETDGERNGEMRDRQTDRQRRVN